MSTHADLLVQNLHRRRAEFATAAALFSVLLHIALLIGLALGPADVPFWRPVFNVPPPRETPLRLHDVNRALPPPLVSAAESVDGESAGAAPHALAQQASGLEAAIDHADTEPPPAAAGDTPSPAPALQDLNLPPTADPWQPRREILEVESAAVRDEMATLERRRTPKLERVFDTPEVVYPARPGALAQASVAGSAGSLDKPSLAAILRHITNPLPARPEPEPVRDPVTRGGTGVLAEAPGDVTDLKPIEALLSARLTISRSRRDRKFGYFRLEITRRSEEALPVLAKDVLFIQDCSASMAEQRLYFCRQALTKSLGLIGPDDRFNVVAFRDQVDSCFEGWMTNSPAARVRAEQFIQGFESRGETDIFAAIRASLNFPVEPGRPVIVILVTDGHATTGLTDGAAIIREFTQANRGTVSVFTMGTTPQAYRYLLDLLSYSNRGDSRVVTRGRWDIPADLEHLAEEVRHPVLSEVGLTVAESTPCEVYPVQMMNLYRNRPLVLYGRFPLEQEHVLLQATGEAAAARCDMIFDFNLKNAPNTDDEDLRETWARQKIFYLLGEHARTGNRELIAEIDATARAYHISVPFREGL